MTQTYFTQIIQFSQTNYSISVQYLFCYLQHAANAISHYLHQGANSICLLCRIFIWSFPPIFYRQAWTEFQV